MNHWLPSPLARGNGATRIYLYDGKVHFHGPQFDGRVWALLYISESINQSSCSMYPHGIVAVFPRSSSLADRRRVAIAGGQIVQLRMNNTAEGVAAWVMSDAAPWDVKSGVMMRGEIDGEIKEIDGVHG
ncbi:hypothetical protein D5086_005062 [Populus alba]|uniref:Uncharacterized protein n=1 Tax=Populus alba TaxID=43335 RepID=A0ACC4CTC1_POPAL